MLDELRKIERVIFQNPILDKNDFPPLDSEEHERIKLEKWMFDLRYDENVCYAYVRENDKGWFIDVYFFMAKSINGEEERFVIAPGYEMSEDEEERFFERLACPFTYFNDRVCASLVPKMRELEPRFNLEDYSDGSITLSHIYFVSHKAAGVRKEIFKANKLENIAIFLSEIDDINIFEKNIVHALYGVPYKMLKKLNSYNAVDKILRTKENRKVVKAVYEQYNTLLNDVRQLNEFQFRYLVECMEKNEFPNKKNLKVLAELKSGWNDEFWEVIDGDEIYSEFMEYQSIIKKDNKYSKIFSRYPSLAQKDIDRFHQVYKLLLYYIENETEIDQKLQELSKSWEEYSYEYGDYCIVIPEGIKDILSESEQQHNCLYTYIPSIVNEYTTIVFMRYKNTPDKSLVTLEIRYGEIYQAFQSFNRLITEEQAYFIEKFAEGKGLLIYEDLY